MVEGQAKILVVERDVFLATCVVRCLDLLPFLLDSIIVAGQCILIFTCLELRQAEVVVEAWLGSGMLHGSHKSTHGFLQQLFWATTITVRLAEVRNLAKCSSQLELSLRLFVQLGVLDRFHVVVNRVLVSAETSISQALIMADAAAETAGVTVAGSSDLIVSKGLLILPKVVIALARVHVEECTATRLRLNLIRRRLLIFKSILVEECSTEVIKGPLIVVHHHVALSTLVVGQRELRIVHARAREFVESVIKFLLLLIFFHFLNARFATFGFIKHFHDLVSILVLFDLFQHRSFVKLLLIGSVLLTHLSWFELELS